MRVREDIFRNAITWKDYHPWSSMGGKCYIHLCVCVRVTYTYPPLPPTTMKGFPAGASGEESACQRRRTKRMWVRSLGGENPLEEEMATHSSILAWRIPWLEEPGTLRSMGSQGVRHDWSNSALVHQEKTLANHQNERIQESDVSIRNRGSCVWPRSSKGS